MKNRIKMVFAVSVLCLGACQSDPDIGPIKRDTDEISIGYQSGATAQFTVRFNGAWNASPLESWLSLEPASGVGNGKDYQYVTVTAQRNAGAERTGTIILSSPSGGVEEQKIFIKQGDGIFTMNDPVTDGKLRLDAVSTAIIVINYNKAFGGEKVVVETTLGGAGAGGLSVEGTYETTVEEEGQGTISIPITGIPENVGMVDFDIVVTFGGVETYNGTISMEVAVSNEVFRFGFDLFVWGGDYVANKAGISPAGENTEADNSFNGTEPGIASTKAGNNGTKDVFNTMKDAYRANRNVSDWSGLRCYERPGYIRLGTSSKSGWIMTPPLYELTSAPQTVILSMDMCRVDNENGGFIISAEGAGVVLNGKLGPAMLPAPTTAAERKWTTLSFTVEGATNQTRLKVAAEELELPGSRMNIDNIVVTVASEVPVTEKLATPDASKIIYIPDDTALSFGWEGVKGATGYSASIAMMDSPSFRNTIETTSTQCDFTGLVPGFYIFTLKALYAPNPEFNSDEATALAGTSGYVVAKLDTPQNLAFTATVSSVTVTWDAVSGAGEYKVVLKDAAGSAELDSQTVTADSHTFAGLTPATAYLITVQAVIPGNEQYDSDIAEINVETNAQVKLKTPSITGVYQVGYLHAIVEFDYEDWVVTSGDIPQFAFRVETAGGTLVPAYTHIQNGLPQSDTKLYSFNNNVCRVGSNVKYNNPRFYLGGLEPNTAYKAYVRTVSYKEEEISSDWSAAADFTTGSAPDTSGYLFYKDFDDFWWAASQVTMSLAPVPAAGYAGMATVDFNQPYYGTTNGTATFGNVRTFTRSNASHKLLLDRFWPEWGAVDGTDFLAGAVNLIAGHLKFGTGSASGSLTLPALADLGSTPTDIILEFDACPYYEPSSNSDGGRTIGQYFPTNSPTTPGAADDCYVSLSSGGAAITEWNGAAQANVAEVQVVNTDQTGMDPNIRQYQYTHHVVKITGATQDTRITIQSKLATGAGRFWLDNVSIRRD